MKTRLALLVFLIFTIRGFGVERPNILWLTAEDASVEWFGCYGSRTGTTPNIDRLAKEGFRYTNAFANAPVCAASRSTWITGLYSLSTGTHSMRSRYPVPSDTVRYYPDFLREAGYYCANHTKTDYNIGGRPDANCWNSKEEYGWRFRAKEQPFFCVINFMESHESRAFGDTGHTRHDPGKIALKKYHPDLVTIRKNYALYEDAVENMDQKVGRALETLRQDGLENDTIVIFCTDHGGVMPRSKRYLYDEGLHAPLIIRIPEKYKHLWPTEAPGMTVDRLVSFVDMPKTWLSLAQVQIPSIMQGEIFLGPKSEKEREFHFAYRGRMDERYDETRAVRDKQYLYIKNYMPYNTWGQHLGYLWKMEAMREWANFFKEGKADSINGLFFRTKPWVEELYDCREDPDNVINISTDPRYLPVMSRMRKALQNWQSEIYDAGLLPESEMVRRAAANKMTIYEMVRDPVIYPLSSYMEASDVALMKEDSNQETLIRFLDSPDSGIRYWGSIGLLMKERVDAAAVKALQNCLNDESHEVRAISAWALIRAGLREEGEKTLIQLLRDNSYAALKVLNIIDGMEGDKNVYRSAIQSLQVSGLSSLPGGGTYEKELISYLLDVKGEKADLIEINQSSLKEGSEK